MQVKRSRKPAEIKQVIKAQTTLNGDNSDPAKGQQKPEKPARNHLFSSTIQTIYAPTKTACEAYPSSNKVMNGRNPISKFIVRQRTIKTELTGEKSPQKSRFFKIRKSIARNFCRHSKIA